MFEHYEYNVDGSTKEGKILGVTSGKVFGNTNVTMEDGYVVRNIYGGGNMASVGKGNYAGGSDDYFILSYGELVNNLWTGASSYNPDNPISMQDQMHNMELIRD